jgi:DNA-directed RNA polymerase subunit RPC12/RpoP
METANSKKSKVFIRYKCKDCGKRFLYIFAEGVDKPEIQKYTEEVIQEVKKIPVAKTPVISQLPLNKPKEEDKKQVPEVNFDEVIKEISVEVQDKLISKNAEYQRGSLLSGINIGG